MNIKCKFHPGKLAATPTVLAKLDPDYAMAALAQHLQGKWGMVDRHDWQINEDSLANGGRLLSVFPLPDEEDNFWIITEADRSVTTILLPSDY